MLKSQERGSYVEVETRSDFYRPGLPKLKTIRLIAYPDDSARVAALQSGSVDMIEYVPWQSMTELGKDPALRMEEHDGPFMYLQFNAARGPFADVRIRRAVAHAINRDEIVKGAFFGRGSALEHLPIPATSEFFNPGLEHAWNHDPAKARQLLAEAGQPNGFECTLLSTAQYGMHKDTAVVVQQHLAAVGIQAKLNLPDWATRVRLGNQGQYDLGVMGTGPDTNDPDGLSVVIDGSLPPSFLRSFGLKTPKMTELLAAGRGEFDPAKRRAIYLEMEKAAIDEVPIAGLTWRNQAYAMKKDVHGFTNLPGMLTFLSAITLESTSIG